MSFGDSRQICRLDMPMIMVFGVHVGVRARKRDRETKYIGSHG